MFSPSAGSNREAESFMVQFTAGTIRRFFIGAPGRAHPLGSESLLQARQGEVLADGKGVHREVESEGSR